MSDEEKCIVLTRAAEAGAFRAALDERGDWRDGCSYVVAEVCVELIGEPEAETWGFYFTRAGRDSMDFVETIQAHARGRLSSS